MEIEKGQYYHIYNRGNRSRKLFYSRENYLYFLKKMKDHLSPYLSFMAWCLMPNHFHLVVFVQKTSHTITSGDSRPKERTMYYSIGILLRSYTRTIQKQENFSGSLFQQHTKARPLIDEIKIEPAYWNSAFGTQINISKAKSYLDTCVEYVHQNPVCDGLVKHAEDWEYSSFRDYLGLRDGKLLDYDLLVKEGLLPKEYSHTSALSDSMTVKNICIIGIGSNIEAEENIRTMLGILKTRVEVLKVSAMLKTKPVGIIDQADFTNGAVKIKTELEQEELKQLLKSIEDEMGRDRSQSKYGPRCIDLDIVVWNGRIVDEDYYTRDFLQKNVKEIID